MEAMAIESMVASAWKLEGYLVEVRHPVRVPNGYSDIDVAGIRGGGEVRFGECKARGPALRVNVEPGRQWVERWEDSLRNIGTIWEEESRPKWLPDIADVQTVEYQLVGNVWFMNDKDRESANEKLTAAVKEVLPPQLRRNARGVVLPSIEVLANIMRQMRAEIVDDGWGRRYGDPLLDGVRELIRYLNAKPAGAGRVASQVRADVLQMLLEASGVKCNNGQ